MNDYFWNTNIPKQLCHYCATKHPLDVVVRIYFDEVNINYYCTTCVHEVLDNIKDIQWMNHADIKKQVREQLAVMRKKGLL